MDTRSELTDTSGLYGLQNLQALAKFFNVVRELVSCGASHVVMHTNSLD